MTIQQEKREVFSDVLDVYKHISDVKLRIEKDVTAAFILAKLGDKDKECVMEMTCNAYYSKDLILSILKKADDMDYELTKEDREYIKQRADAVFDKYMRRIYMIVTLNRNVDGNYLINVLSNYKKDELETADKELTAGEKLKEAVKEKKPEESKK